MRLPFPAIRDLPPLLVAKGWSWDRFASPTGCHDDFWVAEAPDGGRWLVKMSGSFYAWREHTFASLAQALGLCCQSSTYLVLPPDAPPIHGSATREKFQLAIWLLPQHESTTCHTTCPIATLSDDLKEPGSDETAALLNSNIRFASSWLLGEVLGHFCGANEIGERLFTSEHELVLIDNEHAFSTGPTALSSCTWLYPEQGNRSERGMALALNLANDFSAFSDDDLRDLVKLPDGYRVEQLWSLTSCLRLARAAARAFVRSETVH